MGESSGLDQTDEWFARLFEVDSDGDAEVMVVSHRMSAAYDILDDAGYSSAKIEEVLRGCITAGLDPETMARKMVQLRNALREATGS